MIEIRAAVATDADAIADAHVAAWRAAYRPFFPPAYLDSDAFDASRRTSWRRWAAGPTFVGAALFVPVLDGRVVGFGHAGPVRAAATEPAALGDGDGDAGDAPDLEIIETKYHRVLGPRRGSDPTAARSP